MRVCLRRIRGRRIRGRGVQRAQTHRIRQSLDCLEWLFQCYGNSASQLLDFEPLRFICSCKSIWVVEDRPQLLS